jgi:hypothetical protein
MDRTRNPQTCKDLPREEERRCRQTIPIDCLSGIYQRRRHTTGNTSGRLARSTFHLCQIATELERKQVALQVLDQNINTSDATGRLLFNMLAAISSRRRFGPNGRWMEFRRRRSGE